jgi:hypothetical protein
MMIVKNKENSEGKVLLRDSVWNNKVFDLSHS